MNARINDWTLQLVAYGYPLEAAKTAATMRWYIENSDTSNVCECDCEFTYYDEESGNQLCVRCDKVRK
jgi:hypothetical protein